MRIGRGLAAALALLAAGCAAPPYRAARPPASNPAGHAPDIAGVPDAVPREEPKSSAGNPPFYEVDGHRYFVLPTAAGYVERGVASWYGPGFEGLRTATGEPYDMFAMTAAHKTLPLPCYARVTNLSNGRSVVVRINDRGPFVANRIIDLSYSAASKLGMLGSGTAFVEVRALTPSGPPVPLPVNVPAAAAASAGVSNVPATPLPDDPAPAAARHERLYIQVGAFAEPAHAHEVVRRLQSAGLGAVNVLPPRGARHLMRVRIGPIDEVAQFDALMNRLHALGFSDAQLAQ